MAKQRLTAYVPQGVYDEIMAASEKAERPPGWVITQAWNRAPISPLFGAVHAGAEDVEAGLGVPLQEMLSADGSTILPANDPDAFVGKLVDNMIRPVENPQGEVRQEKVRTAKRTGLAHQMKQGTSGSFVCSVCHQPKGTASEFCPGPTSDERF